MFIIFFAVGSVFCGELDETLKAAEQGTASARYNLGFMYFIGDGVAQDYKQAEFWFRKAAEQGDASAQNNLGVMYVQGRGVAQNFRLAYVWLSLATVQGPCAFSTHMNDMRTVHLNPSVVRPPSSASRASMTTPVIVLPCSSAYFCARSISRHGILMTMGSVSSSHLPDSGLLGMWDPFCCNYNSFRDKGGTLLVARSLSLFDNLSNSIGLMESTRPLES